MNEKRKLVLHYPLDRISEPILTQLVTKYDLEPNLLRADVDAHKGGWIEMDLTGDGEQIDMAVVWMKSLGLTLETEHMGVS